MGNARNSIAKWWYHAGTGKRLAKNEWHRRYWHEKDGERIVACRECPKLDVENERCSVPFGSPLRKCVVAATEAHLHGVRGLTTLELGFFKRSFGRHVVEQSGGIWTGIEPQLPTDMAPQIGKGGYGHAGKILFADATFDLVFGNQSFEHWEEPLPGITTPPSYRECLAEVCRVLKPGGTLYLDAPIHLHGHEMFVAGDVPRIVGLFDRDLWAEVIVERWRYDHAPLPRYPTPASDAFHVGTVGCPSYDHALIEDVQTNGSVWLLTVTALKGAALPDASAARRRASSAVS